MVSFSLRVKGRILIMANIAQVIKYEGDNTAFI